VPGAAKRRRDRLRWGMTVTLSPGIPGGRLCPPASPDRSSSPPSARRRAWVSSSFAPHDTSDLRHGSRPLFPTASSHRDRTSYTTGKPFPATGADRRQCVEHGPSGHAEYRGRTSAHHLIKAGDQGSLTILSSRKPWQSCGKDRSASTYAENSHSPIRSRAGAPAHSACRSSAAPASHTNARCCWLTMPRSADHIAALQAAENGRECAGSANHFRLGIC